MWVAAMNGTTEEPRCFVEASEAAWAEACRPQLVELRIRALLRWDKTGHSAKPSGSPPANQKRGGELRRRAARVPNLIGIQGTSLAIKGQTYRDLRSESQP